MSFHPLHVGTATALLGVADPGKFVDVSRIESTPLSERGISAPRTSSRSTFVYTIVIVIISAIIFVAMISIYDIFRNSINNVYARKALINPDSGNRPQDISATLIANRNALISSGIFCLICIMIAIVSIPLLYLIIRSQTTV